MTTRPKIKAKNVKLTAIDTETKEHFAFWLDISNYFRSKNVTENRKT